MSEVLTIHELQKISLETMRENGFETRFPPAVLAELEVLRDKPLSESQKIEVLAEYPYDFVLPMKKWNKDFVRSEK